MAVVQDDCNNKKFSERAIIDAFVSVYNSAYIFDLKNNTCEELTSFPLVHEYFIQNKDKADLQSLLNGATEITTTVEFLQVVLDFLDLSTLSERMKGNSFIHCDFKGLHYGWARATIMPIEFDDSGELSKFVYVTYYINDEKEKEEKLRILSEKDGLTNLLNRRAFERACNDYSIRGIPDDLVVISFDLNELKSTNDSYGHLAGDEIISGLADCLKTVFDNYGNIYRTGGDEFVALINASLNDVEKLLLNLDSVVADWHGNLVEKLSVSKGYTSKVEFPDASLQELERCADRRMYANKADYYKYNGKDRRKDKIDYVLVNQILERANIGIWAIEIDEDKEPRMYADEKMRSLLGVSETVTPEEVYRFWYDRIHSDYYDAVNDSVEKMIIGNQSEVQYPWYHPHKGLIYVRCGGTRDVMYKGGIRLEGSHQNVTNMIHLQKDSLTDLYAKEFFYQRAQEILDANPDQEYRFFVTNIENFKLINEKYGVEASDKLLKHLASAGKRFYPNLVMSGRISADRFVCMQRAVSQTRVEGLEIERKVMENCPIPNITLRYGIYYTKFDRSVPVQTMCDRANVAVDSIKGSFDVKCAVYNEFLQNMLYVKQQILDNMENAITNKEFKVYLQPKHDLHSNKTGGAEALVRWIHPELGFISPADFIPIFEQNGFIKNVDAYVFIRVCEILQDWIHRKLPVVPISINLSRRDFEYEDFAKTITEKVDEYKIPHNLIHFELTESAISDNPDIIVKSLTELHNEGFMIELDDFGVGYASLVTLSEIDFDILKLDMSIIKKDNPSAKRNVLELCSQISKNLDLRSVAEGVETKEQMERIKSLGCDYIQGFFYSKPLPVEEFEQYLLRN